MKNIKAKFRDKNVVITYVSSDVSWALITLEENSLNKKFKVNCSELESIQKLDLINMSNKYLYDKEEGG
tara:strand:- start:7 stop:213 length:207 start_codon:yes stop_codon:yes gene_type:complete